MRKVFGVLVFILLMVTGEALADSITVSNLVAFNSTGIIHSGNGSATLKDSGYGPVNSINGPLDYVSWSQTLDFNPPAAAGSVNAKLQVTLRDDGGCFYLPELALGYVNGQLFICDSWVDGSETYSTNVNLVNNTVNVTIGSMLGGFFIDNSQLTANYTPASAPVPEPATLLLLGMGMLSAGFFSRKKVNG